jgi:hypothetical protein
MKVILHGLHTTRALRQTVAMSLLLASAAPADASALLPACLGSRAALESCAASQVCRAATTGNSGSSSSSRIASDYTNLQCSPVYQGNLCGACEEGHYFVKAFTCRKCLPRAAVVVLYVISVCLLLVFMKLVCHFIPFDGAWPLQQSVVVALQRAGSTDAAGTYAVDTRATGRVIRSNNPCDDKWAVMQLRVSSLLRPLVLYMQYALILASVTGIELPAPLAYPLQALAWAWSCAVPETL